MNRNIRSWRTIVAAAGFALLAMAGTARADIIFHEGTTSAGDVDNLQFNSTSLADNATTVQGDLNITGDPVFNLSGEEILWTTAGGQAQVHAADGEYDYLLIDADDPNTYYTKFVANVILHYDDTITVTATNQFGDTEVATYEGSGDGQNFFWLEVASSQLIDTVLIQTSTESIGHIRQIRIGGVDGPGVEVIPEPASLLLFGTGLAGLGGAVRRRMKARKTAA